MYHDNPKQTRLKVHKRILERLDPQERQLLRQLARETVDFVANPDFPARDAEHRIMAPIELDGHRPIQRFIQAAADPIGDPDELADHHPISVGRVRALVNWYSKVLELRDQLVNANMPLVLAMAKRTRLSNVDFAELISEGNMALLRAIEKFDVARGFKFSTYACRAILKAFSRASMKQSRYRQRFPAEFDPDMEKSDFLETKRESLEADCVVQLREIILRNAADLNDIEATVIRERFAITGDQPKTLEEVGQIIGVTKERVRQIQNKALDKLREALEEEVLVA